MTTSVLFSNNFNHINYGSEWILSAGKTPCGREVLYLKKFDILNTFLNSIGLGKKDPEVLGLIEYFKAWMRLGNFSVSKIAEATKKELSALHTKDFDRFLLKKNIEFINIKILQEPSKRITIPHKTLQFEPSSILFSVGTSTQELKKYPPKASFKELEKEEKSRQVLESSPRIKPLIPEKSPTGVPSPLKENSSQMKENSSQKEKPGYCWKTVGIIGGIALIALAAYKCLKGESQKDSMGCWRCGHEWFRRRYLFKWHRTSYNPSP